MTDPRLDTPRVQQALETFNEQQARSKGFADGLADLIRELPAPQTLTPAEGTIVVLLQRAAAWLHSISKLDKVFDYQAHSAACRSMLELAIDVALISHEPALSDRMHAYEESQVFKRAIKYQEFVNRAKPADVDQLCLDYIPLNEARIKALRQKHWGTDKHPKSWIAAGMALPQLAAEADKRVGSKYEEFYFDHYDRLCWGTHGSTLMLVRKSPPDLLPGIGIMAVIGCQQLAMDLTRRGVKFLGHDDLDIANKLTVMIVNAGTQRHIDQLKRVSETAAPG